MLFGAAGRGAEVEGTMTTARPRGITDRPAGAILTRYAADTPHHGVRMSKQRLDYQNVTPAAHPRVRWRTIVSCSLLGLALLFTLMALVWPQRRWELFSAGISFGVTGVIIYFPYTGT